MIRSLLIVVRWQKLLMTVDDVVITWLSHTQRRRCNHEGRSWRAKSIANDLALKSPPRRLYIGLIGARDQLSTVGNGVTPDDRSFPEKLDVWNNTWSMPVLDQAQLLARCYVSRSRISPSTLSLLFAFYQFPLYFSKFEYSMNVTFI